MSRSTQPPCPQVCWEWIGSSGAWTYIRSSTSCGHHFDDQAGIWRWHDHPVPATSTPEAPRA